MKTSDSDLHLRVREVSDHYTTHTSLMFHVFIFWSYFSLFILCLILYVIVTKLFVAVHTPTVVVGGIVEIFIQKL